MCCTSCRLGLRSAVVRRTPSRFTLYLIAGIPAAAAAADDLAGLVDLLLALGLAAEHDALARRFLDRVRRHERELHHLERDAVRVAPIAQLLQGVGGPARSVLLVGRVATNVVYGVALEEHQRPVVRGRALTADDHPARRPRLERAPTPARAFGPNAATPAVAPTSDTKSRRLIGPRFIGPPLYPQRPGSSRPGTKSACKRSSKL